MRAWPPPGRGRGHDGAKTMRPAPVRGRRPQAHDLRRAGHSRCRGFSAAVDGGCERSYATVRPSRLACQSIYGVGSSANPGRPITACAGRSGRWYRTAGDTQRGWWPAPREICSPRLVAPRRGVASIPDGARGSGAFDCRERDIAVADVALACPGLSRGPPPAHSLGGVWQSTPELDVSLSGAAYLLYVNPKPMPRHKAAQLVARLSSSAYVGNRSS